VKVESSWRDFEMCVVSLKLEVQYGGLISDWPDETKDP
jgi:hypothetical protein